MSCEARRIWSTAFELGQASCLFMNKFSHLVAGTTCATVLTQAILTEGCKSIAAGVNVMDLRIGIKRAVDAVISELKSRALMISTPEEITQVTGFQKEAAF